MRGALVCFALVSTLSACAIQAAVDSRPSRYQPLRAQITGPWANGLSFHVNRPSYAALFEVVPGAGTSLVYPSPGWGG